MVNLIDYAINGVSATPLGSEIVLDRNVPEEGMRSGDVGVVVERHAVAGLESGYSTEICDLLAVTASVATYPASVLRSPTHADRPAVRSEPKTAQICFTDVRLRKESNTPSQAFTHTIRSCLTRVLRQFKLMSPSVVGIEERAYLTAFSRYSASVFIFHKLNGAPSCLK